MNALIRCAATLVAVAASCAAFAAPLDGALDDVAALIQPDNDARRAALVGLLEARGFEPAQHPFDNDSGRDSDPRTRGANVSVTVGGEGPLIVVGAHFDAVFLDDGTMAEGAVDNGASVVVLLHAAEALRGRALGHRIRFVFFDMEEIGLVGSQHYARSIPGGDPVKAMVNLDVNAYGDTVFYGHTRHGHDFLYDALAAGCLEAGLRCIDFPRYPPSDNLRFEQAGIPNVSISVLPAAEVHQLWLLMNGGEASGLAQGFVPDVLRTIHSHADTIERVDPGAMRIAYDALMSLVLGLDR